MVKYSKKLIIFVILLNILYASVALYVLYRTGAESPTLTASWFAFTTTELLAIAGIKVVKERKPIPTDEANNIYRPPGGDMDEIDISDEEC